MRVAIGLPRFPRDHLGSNLHQGGVVRRKPSVRQPCGVLEARSRAVSALQGSSHDVPRGDVVTMMNLLQAHVCLRKDSLHRLGVCHGRGRLRIQRLDENTHASPEQA